MLYFLYPSTLDRYLRDYQGEKSWALVTGSSDGIGKGIAHELCSHGFNVVLHGRNAEKLSRVQASLLAEYPKVQVRKVIADAGSFTASAIDDIVANLQDIHLTVLVNNVGGTAALDVDFKTLEEHTAKEVDAVININLRFTTQLTRALLPTLQRNEPSLIMNIGSISEGGMPWLSVYSPTKAYMRAFSKALGLELKANHHKVEVLGIQVGSVQSQQNHADISFFVPSSRVMARSALARVGCGSANVTGYLPHELQRLFFSIIPEWVLDRILIAGLKPIAESKSKKWR
jgi:17beta-estradiol 17-dehydrogenase / very-long-chain 3-oxoacyl-CoA reductase